MKSREIRVAVVAAVAGILGTVVGAVGGAVTNGLMAAHVQQEERRLQWAQGSYQFTKDDSVEESQIRLFVEQLRNLSMMSNDTVKRLADVTRRYPGCGDSYTEACKTFWVDGILAMRSELRSGKASPEDIEILLRAKYDGARSAIGRLRARSQ